VTRVRVRLVLAVSTLCVLFGAGCSGGGNPGQDGSPQPVAQVTAPAGLARELANADHTRRYRPYLRLLRAGHRHCTAAGAASVANIVDHAYAALISYRGDGLSRLSVLRSLAAGVASNGPPRSCQAVARALVAELRPTTRSGSPYAGFYGSTTAWRAAHRGDPKQAGGYLPRLPNGRDSYAMGGSGTVSYLGRNFDPPVSQPLALASIRSQLLPPGKLKVIYSLDVAANCSETIYLNPALQRLMGSANGVQVELTSGHGISSRFDSAAVNHARLTVGRGRLGGQPCV